MSHRFSVDSVPAARLLDKLSTILSCVPSYLFRSRQGIAPGNGALAGDGGANCLWDWLAGLHRNVEQAPMGLHRLLPIFLFSFLIRLGLGSN